MRYNIILILSVLALIVWLTSCNEYQSQSFVIENKTKEKNLSITIYDYSSSVVDILKLDTVFSKMLDPELSLEENIPTGRYLLRAEKLSEDPIYFYFFLKDNETIKFTYEGEIKTKSSKANEYNYLMNNLVRFEKNYFSKQIRNIRNLQPIYQAYTDSIKSLESEVSEVYKNLFIEQKLYLDFALNPIISKKFNDKIGNFFTLKNGTILQINGSSDSLLLIGFYNSDAYREYVNDVVDKVKAIDNQDFFLEGKSFYILKQLDFDLSKSQVISEFIDPSFYPVNKFIEHQIKTTDNKNYAVNLLTALAKQYNKDTPELSLKYNKWLIRNFYDCQYVKSGEAQRMISFHSLPLGSPSPEFIVKTINDKEIHLSDFGNSYLLLDFWGTWCAPCKEEIPMLNKLYENRTKLNLKILGVAKDQPNVLRKFLSVNDVKYTVAIATDDIIKKYGVNNYPTKFLIDKSGNLIGKNVSLLEIEELISEGDK